jgi:hypothetical protein
MQGEKRQELERPCRFLEQPDLGHGIRILSHKRGNPDTGVGRSLNFRSALFSGKPIQPKEGKLIAYRESDQLIVL